MIFAKDEEGKDIHYRFMLSLSKPLARVEKELMKGIMDTEGVDHIQPHSRYTLEITIGRAFDADEVLAELKPKIEAALSDILMPKLVV
jgi:hypothetical protein